VRRRPARKPGSTARRPFGTTWSKPDYGVGKHSQIRIPYFFWAASPQLELLYERTFRYIGRTCLPGEFEPILERTGVLNGYQRT
jgi:hypothetical protein